MPRSGSIKNSYRCRQRLAIMHDVDFMPLLIITGLAFVVPLITLQIKALNIPVIVGEILCGIIIGKSGFDIITPGPWLDFLSVFGFTFLMFLSGMEIDLSFLKRQHESDERGEQSDGSPNKRHDPFLLGGKVFLLTVGCSLAISYGLYLLELIRDPIFLALVLSTTSVGIVVPTLRELGVSAKPFGQDVLFSSLVADFMTMLLITVYVAKVSTGLSPELLLILVIFVVFAVLYWVSHLLLRKPVTLKALGAPSMRRTEIKMRAAFAIMVLFIVLSQNIGIEIILGAFLAGFLLSTLSADSDLKLLHDKLNGVGFGFFIPLFFIMVGVRFDLRPILSSPRDLVLLPVFLGAAYAVKLVPCILLKRYYSRRNTLAAGVLLASRLTLIIAAADIGRSLSVISETVYSAVILVAVISSTISPIGFYKLYKSPS